MIFFVKKAIIIIKFYCIYNQQNEGFSMNIAYKKVSALIFSVIVTTSACGMEVENTIEAAEQKSPVVWYKKRSVHLAAAITTVAAAYAVAVYMNKIAVPASAVKLFIAPTVQEEVVQIAQESSVKTVQNNQLPDGVAIQITIYTLDVVKEKLQNAVKKVSKEIINLWNECHTE